jgi:hypothetical protein
MPQNAQLISMFYTQEVSLWSRNTADVRVSFSEYGESASPSNGMKLVRSIFYGYSIGDIE